MALGTLEIALILFIILLLFGPRKLPELARAIGKSVNAYKEGLHEPVSRQKKKKRK